MDSERQRFDTLVMHTPHGTTRYRLPWTFSTFDYRELCELLWDDCDASFETAKVNGRVATANGDGGIAVETDRGVISAPLVVDALGWRRVLASGDGYQPPDAPLSRGLEVHPAGRGDDLEIWIDRGYVPAGYGWSFPADDELRIGIGSFDPRFHVKDTTVLLTEDLGKEPNEYQGNWIPHKLRQGDRGVGSSSPATRPGTACRSPPRGSAPRSTSGSPSAASCAASSTAARAASRPLRPTPSSTTRRVEVRLDAAGAEASAADTAAPADLDPAVYPVASASSTGPSTTTCGSRRPSSLAAQRTIRKVPASSRPTPSTRAGLSATWSRPNRPSRSITTAAVSWPVTVAAATPPAPIAETAIRALVT